jgi:hypothetical protein
MERKHKVGCVKKQKRKYGKSGQKATIYVEKQNVKKMKNTYPLAEVKDLNKEYLEQKVIRSEDSRKKTNREL